MLQPRPFFRKFNASWYVQLGKQQINLGKDEQAAYQKYYELLAKRGRATNDFKTVAELLDSYLEWLNEHRAKATYDKAVYYLSHFARFIGKSFPLSQISGIQVTLWIEAQKTWSSSTGNDAVSIVQRAFNWASKRGHIDKSPVAHVEGKPRRRRRETVFNLMQWKEIRDSVKDQAFGELLDFLWATGCRPIEARILSVHHLDLENAIAILPPSEAKGKQHERVIFLPDDALELCRRLVKVHESGPVFRNLRGNPWKKDAINSRFQRLKKKLNRPMCAYAIRHSFATEGLKRGIDSLTLAQIMGHRDTTMLSKHYAHLARNPAYLREVARKLRE